MRRKLWTDYKRLGVRGIRSVRSSRATWAFMAGLTFSLIPLVQMKLACMLSFHICSLGYFDRVVFDSVQPQVLLTLGVGSIDFTAIALFFMSTGLCLHHAKTISLRFIEYVRDTGMTLAGAVLAYAVYDFRVSLRHPNLIEILAVYAVFLFGLLLVALSPMMLKIKHPRDRVIGASAAVLLLGSTPYLVTQFLQHLPTN